MAAKGPPSPSPSQLPPVPASPTYSYASTANPLSQYNLPLPPPPRPAHAVLTKLDLASSQTAYADLLASAKSYRLALTSLSTAASAFGSALEACARLKEARADALGPAAGASLSNSFHAQGACTADTLLTVAGLQHLVANHQQILSETVYRAFEVPLLHDLDKWRATIDDEEERYARAVKSQSREIRRLEKEGLKLHRQRRRDVAKFRSHLVELTTQLDGLTSLHAEHARGLLRESQDTSARIVDASCSLVRAEVDIFESLAKKGWTGGGLEEVLEKGVDLFASEDAGAGAAGTGAHAGGGSGDGSKLFSILPPRSILADSASDMSRRVGHGRTDSLLVEPERYQSLAGAVSDPGARDTDSVFSEFNRPRGARPFSPQPQPLQLNPVDLLVSLEAAAGEPPTPQDEGRAEHGPLGHEGQPTGGDGRQQQQQQQQDEQQQQQPKMGRADEPDTEDEEAHPWRDVGLRRSSTENTARPGGIDIPDDRNPRWSTSEDDEGP